MRTIWLDRDIEETTHLNNIVDQKIRHTNSYMLNWFKFWIKLPHLKPARRRYRRKPHESTIQREKTQKYVVARAERRQRRRGEKALSTYELCAPRRCSNDCCCCRLVLNQGILSKIRSSSFHPRKTFLQGLFDDGIRIVGLYMGVLMLKTQEHKPRFSLGYILF